MAVVLAIAVPPAAFALRNEPKGFGDARFRASRAEVKKIFPQLKATFEPPADAPVPIAFYQLDKQSIFGLEPCQVELRFATDRLYEIQVNCGHEERVIDALKAQFGRPSQKTPLGWFWHGEKVSVTLNPVSKVFAFVERELSGRVQASLLNALAQPPQAGSQATPEKADQKPDSRASAPSAKP